MNTSLLDEILFRRLGQSVHTRIRAALLKTGQTTQYGGYPDDGYYQKGVAKRYEILTLGQYSGVTNIVLNVKTDAHSNNCVLDLNTGLIWNRYHPASIGPTSDGALPFTTNINGEGIFPFCAAANLAGLAGYSDWRIPNVYELFSLTNIEAPNALPNPIVFPTITTTVAYYTSTTVPSTITSAYVITFLTGSVGSGAKTGNRLPLLVRGPL